MTDQYAFEFHAQAYAPSRDYDGRFGHFDFRKHFYGRMGDFDSKEEFECACHLDMLAQQGRIQFWVRNLVRRLVDVDLLDGNVALQRMAIVRDAKGHRRLARIYGFEFTVTGEARHPGTITQFGAHSAQIELAPYPFEIKPPLPSAEVIELSQWRQDHATKNRH